MGRRGDVKWESGRNKVNAKGKKKKTEKKNVTKEGEVEMRKDEKK